MRSGPIGPWHCPVCSKTLRAPGGHKKWCGKPFDEQGALWDRLMPLPWSGCWIWMGPKYSTGYGVLWYAPIRGEPGKQIGAHRLAWMLAKGPIPDGMEVLHICDEPYCCNPGHLRLGTHAENMADCKAKRRHVHGERNMHAKLTEDQAKLVLSLKNKVPAGDLADEYGVRNGAIEAIWAGRAWKHLHAAQS